jgi:hypothetical protein
MGFWMNAKQVLLEPIDNGIEWPVINGCNQYTLTVRIDLFNERLVETLYRLLIRNRFLKSNQF